MKVVKFKWITGTVAVLAVAATVLSVVNANSRDAVAEASCECAIVSLRVRKSELGMFSPVWYTARPLLQKCEGEQFRALVFSRCMAGFDASRLEQVSNAVESARFDVKSESDNELRFLVTAQAHDKRIAESVADIFAKEMKSMSDEENALRLEKSLSQMRDKIKACRAHSPEMNELSKKEARIREVVESELDVMKILRFSGGNNH